VNIRRHRAYLHANLCASDNGSAFVDAWLLRGCAVLGIRLIHSRPGKPPLTGQSLDHLPVVLP
jgi:transposase InsO family protein